MTGALSLPGGTESWSMGIDVVANFGFGEHVVARSSGNSIVFYVKFSRPYSPSLRLRACAPSGSLNEPSGPWGIKPKIAHVIPAVA